MSDTEPVVVEVWNITTPSDPDFIQQLSRQLSDEEQSQANRLVKYSQRHTYISSHVAMRRILASKLAIDPENVHYQKQQHGKPFIDREQAVYFNLSHSDDHAILGVSRQSEVGVDIEKKSYHRDLIAIAERFFTAEEFNWLKVLPPDSQSQAFYQLWCHKEAFLKATGQGITAGLQYVNLSPDNFNQVTRVRDQARQDWFLHTLKTDDTFCAAIAVNCSSVDIQDKEWCFD